MVKGMNALLLLMLSSAAQAAVCPSTISDRQEVAIEEGVWSVRIPNQPRPLEMVVVFSGNPKNRQSLVGDKVGRKGMKWDFSGADVWIECRYRGSSAIVSGRVGAVRHCEYSPPETGTADPAKFSCTR